MECFVCDVDAKKGTGLKGFSISFGRINRDLETCSNITFASSSPTCTSAEQDQDNLRMMSHF